MNAAPVAWHRIRLAVFDMDGTLYDQRRLRIAMLARLLRAAAGSRSLADIAVLRAFRQCREELGDAGGADFMERQYALTARRTGLAAAVVRSTVENWMERRPLEALRACRLRSVERVFAGLATRGTTVAILSDYPAEAKLQALGLRADIVVSAGDPEVGFLKPHPAGLARVLHLARVPAGEAIMIGDRVDRDGAVARAHGMRALIRSRRRIAGVETFRSFCDPVFGPLACRPEG